MTIVRIVRPAASRPDPRLAQALVGLLFLGVVVIASLPAARGDSAMFGSIPLWLLGLPLIALAALHLSRALPARAQAAVAVPARRRRGGDVPQPRRREAVAMRARMPRAA